ncbi:hypothetical protein [Luteimonas sp. FCS-9]|uniref:hypothetical protein n=1 Tax=Luteimonas sp. FCS-9 TaxID=1547516 RepID=UPI00063E99C6|nr:hypothetical protein [Luteimonas sp. FCS-9]KLJ00571.1 hypothetical protein WQ56_09010 [Luteimonas sp. FCS-9]
MHAHALTRRRHRRRPPRACLAVLPLLLWLGGCERPAPAAAPVQTGGATPVEAVEVLTGHLRRGDLAAFAHDALPADLAPALEQAWREDRTRWPLSELPLSAQLPTTLAALHDPHAERVLLATFDRQFAGADRELRSTARALAVFATQYLTQSPGFSDDERRHYTQLVAATGDWAAHAPLADRALAQATVEALTTAARRSALDGDAALGRAGMSAGLTRLSPLFVAGKQQLRAYGLDLDVSFDSVETTLASQTGDQARVRLRYLLDGRRIDAEIGVERTGGRWYVADFLRHARAAAAAPPASAPAP